jgi:hypothetical protein
MGSKPQPRAAPLAARLAEQGGIGGLVVALALVGLLVLVVGAAEAALPRTVSNAAVSVLQLVEPDDRPSRTLAETNPLVHPAMALFKKWMRDGTKDLGRELGRQLARRRIAELNRRAVELRSEIERLRGLNAADSRLLNQGLLPEAPAGFRLQVTRRMVRRLGRIGRLEGRLQRITDDLVELGPPLP